MHRYRTKQNKTEKINLKTTEKYRWIPQYFTPAALVQWVCLQRVRGFAARHSYTDIVGVLSDEGRYCSGRQNTASPTVCVQDFYPQTSFRTSTLIDDGWGFAVKPRKVTNHPHGTAVQHQAIELCVCTGNFKRADLVILTNNFIIQNVAERSVFSVQPWKAKCPPYPTIPSVVYRSWVVCSRVLWCCKYTSES